MKLLDLHLLAFGPFADCHFDLSAGNEGLHVIFGPNEAGKSSALRALRGFLFGIPERTRDDFRHEKTALRVGGVLRAGNGDELSCYRRKGRRRTLLDARGEAIADDRLSPFLGGVDELLFERLFGIDHDALVSGGQALLAERGREAEALFGAGLGSSTVHSVLEALEQEAQSLFAPRASKPLINLRLTELAELRRIQREVSLSARQWDEARKAVIAAQTRLADLDRDLGVAEKRQSVLQRVRRTMPGLARRAQVVRRTADLGDVPILEADFGQRREAALMKLRTASEHRSIAAARLADLQSQMASLEISDVLLAESDAVVALRDRLAGYSKAVAARPALAAECESFEEQARQKIAEVRPDLSLKDVDQLRPLLTMRRRSAELGGRQEALESAVDKGAERKQEEVDKLRSKREALSELPPPAPSELLRQALRGARRAGDLDRAIGEAKATLDTRVEACERALASLGLWAGDGDGLIRAALPGEDTLHRFADEFQAIAAEWNRLERELADIRAERHRTEESLRALRLAGSVPTEAELQVVRERRDQSWVLLRRHWIDGENLPEESSDDAGQSSMMGAFENDMAVADEIADRLRREAQRVHEQAASEARLEAGRLRATEANRLLQELAGKLEELQQSWQDLWNPFGISPLPPAEMLGWMDNAARLREQLSGIEDLIARLDELKRHRESRVMELRGALAACGAGRPIATEDAELKMVLDCAEGHLNAIEVAESRRSALQLSIAELEQTTRRLQRECEKAKQELATWRSDWGRLMRELGRREQTTSGEALDHLQTVTDVIKLVDEAGQRRRRYGDFQAEILSFEEDVRAMLTSLAPDLLSAALIDGVRALDARHDSHKETKSRLDELDKQAQQSESELRQAEQDIAAAATVLAELCEQARCDSAEELQRAEQRFYEHRQLVQERQAIENELLESGDGLDIAALEIEAGAVDRDSVVAELNSLTQQIDRALRPQRESCLEQKIDAERVFRSMTGSDEAAQLADQAQQTIAGLRGHAQHYLRLRLAARVLRDEIERFRQRHRDPILAVASAYFDKLTCGSMTAIGTDFDDSDHSILVGIRPGGERLRVEAMSTGTRDQLYLALRLATLEHYFESSEPLPFVVDDILIQFDDGRTASTLNALVEFSSRTQVILFTHHRRVVEEASALDKHSGQVFVHHLDSAA